MPLFKIGIPGTEGTKKMVKGDSIQNLINSAIEKFGLPPDDYKLCIDEDKTELDDDDVLLEYANQCEQKKNRQFLCL